GLAGVLGLSSRSASAERTTAMYQQNVLGAELAQEIRFQFLASRFNSTNATYAPDPEAKAGYVKARNEARGGRQAAGERLLAETRPTAEVRAAVEKSLHDIATYIEL